MIPDRRAARATALAIAALAVVFSAACSRTVPVVYGPTPSGTVITTEEARRLPRRLGRVPPGHYPPPGHCRIWYAGRPPGHQPPPRRCGDLRGRVPRGAFILYNDSAWDMDYDWRLQERRRPGSVPAIILELVAAAMTAAPRP